MPIITITMVDAGTGMENPPMAEAADTGEVGAMVDDSLVKKVGHLVTRHTKEALSVIRTWMNEKA